MMIRAVFASLIAIMVNAMVPISAHAQLRPMVYSDITVPAPQERVWQDWTRVEGLEAHYAPKAIVDLRPGGAYEIWFAPNAPAGQRGAEDGVILGLQDQRMIQFTWKMPPYMPDINDHMTVVQMWFVPLDDDRTRIRLFHTGFGDSPDWQKGRDYFAKTWPQVLTNYKTHVEGDK